LKEYFQHPADIENFVSTPPALVLVTWPLLV